MKQSFSTSEVAAYCHVTADTIRKWAEAGRIRVFKTPGGHRRIRREDLIRFLRENNIPIHGDLKEDGVKILIADSDMAALSSIQRFLDRSSGGFIVETASDAFETGHRMALFEPDVLFLDLNLPGVEGIDLCRRMKSDFEHPGTQIIIVGADDGSEFLSRGPEPAVAAFMRKPFTPDDLRRCLAQLGIEIS